ncbi:MAG: Hsp20/alpha crystallin family protein [Candidatus Sericytochromatia bacterium]
MANIARRNPNSDLMPTFDTWIDDFFSGDFNHMLNRLSRTGVNLPAVNISESHEGFHLEMATPGLRKDDIHVTLQDNTLVISAEKKQESQSTDRNLRRQEFSCSTFRRAFTLPENVESDKLLCAYEDGVLKLDIPKRNLQKEKGARQIPIK